MRILFVSANDSEAYLDIEREQRTLLKLAETNGHSLKFLPGVQVSDLERELAGNDGKRSVYDVLHFAGHGTREGLRLRGASDDDFEELSGEKLAKIITASRQGQDAEAGRGLKLVVLNACSTAPVVEKIEGVVDEVIGTKWDIKDRSARSFSNDFYTALDEQATVREAFEKSADEDGPYIRRPVRNPDPSIKLPPAEPSGEAKIEGLGDFYDHYYGDYIDDQIRALGRDRRLNNYVFYALLSVGAVLWIYLLQGNHADGDVPHKLMATLTNAFFPTSGGKPMNPFAVNTLWARIHSLQDFAPAAAALFQKRFSAHLDPKVRGLTKLRDSIRNWDNLPDEDREMIRSVMHESLKESLKQ